MKIILPLEVVIPRKTKDDKRVALNLNIYRNLHHMTLNQAKIAMKDCVRVALPIMPANVEPPPYRFTYTIFPKTGRALDLGNVGSIVQKFTDDALVELGIIKDDNHKIVSEVMYKFGGVDKDNPRAELQIESIFL